MDYQRIYDAIIARRKVAVPEGYSENHHIVPESFGGNDTAENRVRLTAREHFVCHWLLTKIHPTGRLHYKAMHAFVMMAWRHSSNQQRYRCTSRLYEKLKKDLSQLMTRSQQGNKNSQYGTMWINDGTISKKIQKGIELEEGWVPGRIKKPKPPKVKKERVYNGAVKETKKKEQYTVEEKKEALLQHNGNIRKALYSLGLNDSGAHYRVMKEIKAVVYPRATNPLKG